MTTREVLPARRPCLTVNLDFGGRNYAVGIGFYPDGRLAEAFVSGEVSGSMMGALLNDAAILVSLLLQFGVEPRAIAKSMSMVGDGQPASPVGALADLIASEASRDG